jgi:hypothetical protein
MKLSLVLGSVLALVLIGTSSAITISLSSDNPVIVNGQAFTHFELNTAPIEGDTTVINDINTLDHVVAAPTNQTLTMAADGSLVTEDVLAKIQYVAISVNAKTNCGPLPLEVYTVIKNKVETGEPLDQIITDIIN